MRTAMSQLFESETEFASEFVYQFKNEFYNPSLFRLKSCKEWVRNSFPAIRLNCHLWIVSFESFAFSLKWNAKCMCVRPKLSINSLTDALLNASGNSGGGGMDYDGGHHDDGHEGGHEGGGEGGHSEKEGGHKEEGGESGESHKEGSQFVRIERCYDELHVYWCTSKRLGEIHDIFDAFHSSTFTEQHNSNNALKDYCDSKWWVFLQRWL